MKIVVLGGGDSTERDVSLRSSRAVGEALNAAGFETVNLDPIDPQVLNEINHDDIVFPILHGNNGEDGKIQQALESRGLPYLGTESQQSSVCFDKARTREAFKAADLPVASGDIVSRDTYTQHELTNQPHVLKITEGGSSIGTYMVYDPQNVDVAKVDEVFNLGEKAVIEELVTGTEITVPVLDGTALPVIEIKPPENEEFDYVNKYNGKTKEICPAVSLNEERQKQAQIYAERAHESLGCRHLSRVDMIVRDDGTMVLLEINTMPGMTNQSLYPLSAKVAGYTFPDLMKRFVELVKRDYSL